MESLGLQFKLDEPLSALYMDFAGRDIQLGIGWCEGLMLVGQTSVPEWLLRRWKVFGKFTDHGVLSGAYGVRAHGALGLIVDELRRDPDSRRAVLTINQTHRDLASPARDVPCTLSLQFLLRDGKLNQVATMRSNDLWLGLPYDLIMFAMLQAAIARDLGVEVGWYIHQAASAHIYEQHWEKAREVGDEVPSSLVPVGEVWGGETIAEIGERCRTILAPHPQAPIQGATEFELAMSREMERTWTQ